MKQKIFRAIGRILFAAAAAAIVYVLILLPVRAVPTLLEDSEIPSLHAATAAVPTRVCALCAPAIPSVTEPDPEPEPVKEPAAPGDIFAFMYHDLTDDLSETSVWRTTVESMASDLDEIEAMGYLPLSLEDYLTGNYEIGPDYYIITFDDGYRTNLTMAEPLLAARGLKATVFVITGSTEIENHMTWDDLRTLQSHGVFTIYSHTDSHMNAGEHSQWAFVNDAAEAWQKLTDNLGEPEYKILSFPNGDYTRELMRALAADGYELFTIQNVPWWYKENNADGIRVLTRMNVAYDADMEYLVDFNRARSGFPKIAVTLAERAAKAEAERLAAIAAVREERRAWIEGYAAGEEGNAAFSGKGLAKSFK